jgi:hypothetical protein
MIDPMARSGSSSQPGPGNTPKTPNRMLLTIPHSELSIQRNDRMVGIEGTAHGRMKTIDTQRIQRCGCTNRPDTMRASRSLRFTATSRKTSVLRTPRR